MNSLHVLPLQPESFVSLVKMMKEYSDQADIFEIWLDGMKVKGDLAVIRKYFEKPMIAKSENLEMLKRGVKAGLQYADIPYDLLVDMEFDSLVKNKGAKIIRSYHNYQVTPEYERLLEILEEMEELGAHFFKISTYVHDAKDAAKLMELLREARYHGKLIITGMGDMAREVRIKAPLEGSVFYYAPIHAHLATAPGQLTKSELEEDWELL